MDFTQIGGKTRTVVLKHQSHKLQHEFQVEGSSTVKVGQPIEMAADGTIKPLSTAANAGLRNIGISVHDADGSKNERATVGLKAFQIVFGRANADSQPAGPVKFIGQSAVAGEEDFGKYAAANVATDGTEIVGIALDPGDENDQIRIALF